MCNMGQIDKFIRLILIFAVMGYSIYHQSMWGMLALIPLAGAAISYCPFYSIFKINTGCKKGMMD
jgi:hypothetical protein